MMDLRRVAGWLHAIGNLFSTLVIQPAEVGLPDGS